MAKIEIVDVTDETRFGLLPPCADPAFDHRTCDYWEDRERGSKAHRAGWLEAAGAQGEGPGALAGAGGRPPANPFAPDATERPPNPFAPTGAGRVASNPFT